MKKLRITKLPATKNRVETGPLRFGNDWPGIFIRGDDALAVGHSLSLALGKTSELVELLLSCNAATVPPRK